MTATFPIAAFLAGMITMTLDLERFSRGSIGKCILIAVILGATPSFSFFDSIAKDRAIANLTQRADGAEQDTRSLHFENSDLRGQLAAANNHSKHRFSVDEAQTQDLRAETNHGFSIVNQEFGIVHQDIQNVWARLILRSTSPSLPATRVAESTDFASAPATPPPPTQFYPRTPAPLPPVPLNQVVASWYGMIQKGDLWNAFCQTTKHFTDNASFDAWKLGFANTRRITGHVFSTSNPAIVRVAIETEDATPNGPSVKRFAGTLSGAIIDNRWVIDDGQIQQLDAAARDSKPPERAAK